MRKIRKKMLSWGREAKKKAKIHSSIGFLRRRKEKKGARRLITSTSVVHRGTCDFMLNRDHLGLLISKEDSSSCRFQFCPDINLVEVSSDVYAPGWLTNVRELGGGGSGVKGK